MKIYMTFHISYKYSTYQISWIHVMKKISNNIRQTLRYLGVPIKSKAYMFGDNKSVVTSSTVPHSLLSKRHNILSYHRVREAIATKILVFIGVTLPRTRVIFSVSTGNSPRYFTSSETSLTSKERSTEV